MVVGACQSFQYFRQKNWFLGDNKLCLNLGIGFWITWLVLPNYKKISPWKPILNWATLNKFFFKTPMDASGWMKKDNIEKSLIVAKWYWCQIIKSCKCSCKLSYVNILFSQENIWKGCWVDNVIMSMHIFPNGL